MLRRSLRPALSPLGVAAAAARTGFHNGRRLDVTGLSCSLHSSTRAAGRATGAEAGSSYYSAAARARANAALEGFALPQGVSREELNRMLNETLQNRSRKFALSAAAGMGLLGLIAYLYRKEGRAAVVEEISDVASRSLSDEKMQAQAQLVTIQTLQALLAHGETVQRSVSFLSQVAEHEQTREAVVNLLVTALKNPAVVEEALQLVLWVLDDSRARENLVTCLISALTNPRFEEAAAEFAVRWLAHESVSTKVSEVFKDASLTVLEEDTVRENAEQFVQGLLQEPQLQAKTSEHLWGAVKGLIYSPKPKSVPAVGTVVGQPAPPVSPAALSGASAASKKPTTTAAAAAPAPPAAATTSAAPSATAPAASSAATTSVGSSAAPTASTTSTTASTAAPAPPAASSTTAGRGAQAVEATATGSPSSSTAEATAATPAMAQTAVATPAEHDEKRAKHSTTHLKRASSDSMPDSMGDVDLPAVSDAEPSESIRNASGTAAAAQH